MHKTSSLSPLFFRHALFLLILPILLSTLTLTSIHHQAHAFSKVSLRVFSTDQGPKSFEVVFTTTDKKVHRVCEQFYPSKWSEPAKLSGDVNTINILYFYPLSATCGYTSGDRVFITNIQKSVSQFINLACSFDYRNDQLSDCVSPITVKTHIWL
jgi:hypothetical protein